MNANGFALLPFPGTCPSAALNIECGVARRFNVFFISYELSGAVSELIIPAFADIPLRKRGLWEETCFEFFLAVKNSSRYWEFNLSAAGHWNVYRFSDYRQGMQEEKAFNSLPFDIQRHSESLRLSLELDLDKIFPKDQSLDAAVSAIIKERDGRMTYWALAHSGPQADFHRRGSFIVRL